MGIAVGNAHFVTKPSFLAYFLLTRRIAMKDSFERKYFAACNSAEGFVNYYPRVFSPERCKRLYVLKGGPGTGKSRFLREVAAYAEARGERATYYYCSYDPESLDGIFLEPSAIGLLDGTAPHVYEPQSVGVFEQIVNLGQFWDERRLAAHRAEVEHLTKEKQNAFSSAYSYLRAAGAVDEAVRSGLMASVRWEKLTKRVEHFVSTFPRDKRPREEIALCGGIGMRGRVRFDTYECSGERTIRVDDYASLGQIYLGEVLRACRARGVSVRYSPDPVFPDRIDAMELLSNGTSLVLAQKGEEAEINVRRFLDEECFSKVRKSIRFAEKQKKMLLTASASSFETARGFHFALEEIFGMAMDFSDKESFTENFCHRLFE